jgi:predicted transcriptional regulator
LVTRAHIVLPEELLNEVDKLTGKRKRSQFVEEAIKEKLARERQKHALIASVGVLNPADYPDWDTPEKVSAWVRASRQVDNEALRDKLPDTGEAGA